MLDKIPKLFKVERLIHLPFHWPSSEVSKGGTSLYWSNFSLSSVTNSIHMDTLNHQDDRMVNAKGFLSTFLFQHLCCVVEIGKAFMLVPFQTQDYGVFFIVTQWHLQHTKSRGLLKFNSYLLQNISLFILSCLATCCEVKSQSFFYDMISINFHYL